MNNEKKDSKEEANETIKNISYINDISGKNNSLKREDIPIVMDETTHTYQKKKEKLGI